MLRMFTSKHLIFTGLLAIGATLQAAHCDHGRPPRHRTYADLQAELQAVARDRSRTPERRRAVKPLELSKSQITDFRASMHAIIATHGHPAEIPAAIAQLEALKHQVTDSSCPPNIKLQREIALAIGRLAKYGPR